MATLCVSSLWPVMVTLPWRTMLRLRNSSAGMPSLWAAISTICSTTKFIWGEPNPRIAPATMLFVYTPTVSQWTLSTT